MSKLMPDLVYLFSVVFLSAEKLFWKMSPEKLFEKFVKSAEIFKSDKSGQQKNLYRLVNQLD